MSEVLKDIIIGIISGVIPSIIITIFMYYKYLKRIPNETEAKINNLLNDRLGYETSNHNAIMNALNPNNAFLSSEHSEIKHELSYIKTNVDLLKDKNNADYTLLNEAGKNIVNNIESLSNFADLFVDLHRKNIMLENNYRGLQTNLDIASEKIRFLESEVDDIEQLKNIFQNENTELKKKFKLLEEKSKSDDDKNFLSTT